MSVQYRPTTEFDDEVNLSFQLPLRHANVVITFREVCLCTRLIQPKNRSKNVVEKVLSANLPSGDSNACFGLRPGGGEIWHEPWYSVLITLMQLHRYSTPYLFFISVNSSRRCSQVADIIVASLLVDGTAVPRKVSRLHLICDILHNSAASVRNAWKFRQEFQTRLPTVFDHLSTIHQSFPGRITAETFKKQIIAVIEVWENWIVFPADFTSELRTRLDGSGTGVAQSRSTVEEEPVQHEAPVDFSTRFKTSSFKPAAEGENDADENNNGDDDLDGEVMDDIDGEPVDLDADPVDGEPIPDDGDIDGEPVDLDGAPMDQ